MASIVTLTRLLLDPSDFDTFLTGVNELSEALKSVEGFRSYTVWRDVDQMNAMMLVSHFRNEDAAMAAMQIFGQSAGLKESYNLLLAPPEVRRLDIGMVDGIAFGKTQFGHFMSVSDRVASPGQGEDLRDEVENILMEIRWIEGCLGVLCGTKQGLSDEVIGIALWDNRGAYDQSLPASMPYPIELYARVI